MSNQHTDAALSPLRRRLLLLLDPITWLCCEADGLWNHAPRWALRLRDTYTAWFLNHTLAPRMAHAAAAGVGVNVSYVPPETDAATVAQWFEAQIQASQVVRVAPFDSVQCLIFRDSHDDSPIQDCIGQWEGAMGQWWMDGADAITALVPTDHTGLHLVICRISDLFAAAHQPDLQA
ncbi:MAG: hypothetical protein HC828_01585 [Blastochloris sp.]|nr:hypothetical protein [Blastochloris sp.]